MAKKILSVEIGVWWTKVVLMDDLKKNPVIYDAFYFNTPDHSVEDGFIRDKEVFETAFTNELTKRKITEKNVIFTLNSSKLVTREVTIPFVKDNQIAGIVEIQAKEFFPMNLVNYTISHKKMETITEEEGKKIKLLLVAVPDNLLENYATFAEDVKLNVRNYEYMGNSAINLICEDFMYNSVVVQLEENTTIVSMIADKKLVFQRVTPYGYNNLLTTVLDNQVLGVEDDRAAFAFLETHDVIHIRGKVSEFVESGITDPEILQRKLDEAYHEISEAYNYYVRIVATAIEYFQNQTKGDFRGRIHVIGDGARFAGARKLFDDSFPLEAVKTDYLEVFRMHKDIRLNYLPGNYGCGLLSVAGVLMDPFHIQPKFVREKAGKSNARKKYFMILAGAAVISIGMIAFGVLKETAAKQEQQDLTTQRDQLAYIRKIYSEHDAMKAEADVYINFDNATYYPVEDYTAFIGDLEEHFPTDVTVQNLMVKESVFNVNIECGSKLSAAQVLMNLSEIPYITDLDIPSFAMAGSEDTSVKWQYTLTGKFIFTESEATE